MPGLVPGIHVLTAQKQEDVDGRNKPGRYEITSSFSRHCEERSKPGSVIPGRCQRVRAKRGAMTGPVSKPESRDFPMCSAHPRSGASAPSTVRIAERGMAESGLLRCARNDNLRLRPVLMAAFPVILPRP